MDGYQEVMDEPDLQDIDERLWELYVSWCENSGVKPKIKHYLLWLDERYD